MKQSLKNRLFSMVFAPCCGYLAEENEDCAEDSFPDHSKDEVEGEEIGGFKMFTKADNCGPHVPMNCPKRRKHTTRCL